MDGLRLETLKYQPLAELFTFEKAYCMNFI